jgi:hypothetical protein
MKILCCALFLAGTSLFAGPEGPPLAPVGVYVEYENPTSGPTPELIQNDVQSILSPLGFDIQWRPTQAAGNEVWSDLAVVTFEGDCSFAANSREKFIPGALGWTRAVGADIQPFIGIDCRRIGSLLQTQVTSALTRNPERLFARAVARVLAHELYHVLARSRAHQDSGVGKAEFTVKDLLTDRFQFHPEQARLLRKSSQDDVRHFPASAETTPRRAAPEEPKSPTPSPTSSLYFPRAASQ